MTDCKNCKYTDEYCASGDCTAQNDLTEQWKKGELPEGYYYVKDGKNMIAEYLDGYFYNDGNPMTSFSGGVDSVLAPVPSYEEWEQLQNWADFTDDYHALREAKEIAEYEKVELLEKVKQLKELLKEYKDITAIAMLYAKSDEEYKQAKTVREQIDEVLK